MPGYLTPEEYINALRMLGLNPSQKKAEEWKKEVSHNFVVCKQTFLH